VRVTGRGWIGAALRVGVVRARAVRCGAVRARVLMRACLCGAGHQPRGAVPLAAARRHYVAALPVIHARTHTRARTHVPRAGPGLFFLRNATRYSRRSYPWAPSGALYGHHARVVLRRTICILQGGTVSTEYCVVLSWHFEVVSPVHRQRGCFLEVVRACLCACVCARSCACMRACVRVDGTYRCGAGMTSAATNAATTTPQYIHTSPPPPPTTPHHRHHTRTHAQTACGALLITALMPTTTIIEDTGNHRHNSKTIPMVNSEPSN
jgi:hypothetical protein